MKRKSRALLFVLGIGACGAPAAAFADNLLGFYMGAGAGYSSVRSGDSAYGLPGYFNAHQTAWKGIVGIRPISLVGFEGEYIDFGRPDHRRNFDVNASGRDSHPHAGLAFAVGYLPLPLPLIDIYGKVGLARLTSTVNTIVPNCDPAVQNCTGVPPTVDRHDRTDTKFAYGAGIQTKLPFGLGLRAEYERISSRFGSPDAVTISGTWTF